MEHHVLGLLCLMVIVTVTLTPCQGGSDGKHGRKIIIHVPYYIKNHHHTHTVYKYVKSKGHDEGGHHHSAGGGDSHDSGSGANLEQADELHDGFDHHHHHHEGDAEFIGHHHFEHFHDDGEASHDAPQALGLHATPLPAPEHHRDEGHHHHHHHPADKQSDSHMQEQSSRYHRDHHQHHHHHHDEEDRHEHAHFHSRFTVNPSDGPAPVHETDSSEVSGYRGHGIDRPHRTPFSLDSHREREVPSSYEETEHGNRGEGSSQEQRYPESYNSLQSEQRTEETRQYPYGRDQIMYNRNHRRRKGVHIDDLPKRQKFDVKEFKQEPSSSPSSHIAQSRSPDYSKTGRIKHSFNWR